MNPSNLVLRRQLFMGPSLVSLKFAFFKSPGKVAPERSAPISAVLRFAPERSLLVRVAELESISKVCII